MSERKMLSDGGVGLRSFTTIAQTYRYGFADYSRERCISVLPCSNNLPSRGAFGPRREVEALELAKFPCLSSSDNELNDPMGSDSLSLLSPLPIGPP